MPKEFSEWVGQMANSIEDLSIVDRFEGEKLCGLQKRMLLADCLVPFPETSYEVDDWLTAFSLGLGPQTTGSRQPTQIPLSNLIGKDHCAMYISCTGDRSSTQWLRELKRQIKHKTLRRD